MWRRLSALLLFSGALACAAGSHRAGSGLDEKAATEPDCLGQPAVHLYLESVRQAVYAKWSPPAVDPKRRGMVRFVLAGNGSLLSSSIVGAPEDPVAQTALHALAAAAPFAPIPAEAQCLAHSSVVLAFVVGDRTAASQVAPAPRR